jgi:peptidyl-prolyl cis-trans isomerase SurA
MTRIYFFLLLGLIGLSLAAPVNANQEGIAAVVNQDVISMSDLNDRTTLIIVSSGLPNTQDIRTKLTKQVMEGLIEEQLMLQEAERREIKISDSEVQQGFAALAQQNKISPEEFQKAVQQSGVNLATMRRQIRAQMGWSKVIQKAMRPRVTITDSDIDEYLARIASNKGKEEYLLAEIMLPVDTPEQENDVRQLAAKLVSEMRAGKAPFSKVAQQFSKAPGAPTGGDLGWMKQGQLPQELEAPLAYLQPKQMTDPIRTTNGYHILLLRDRRAITDETLPTREAATNTIGLQRLERLQRGYLMDLKSSAFIENRVQS